MAGAAMAPATVLVAGLLLTLTSVSSLEAQATTTSPRAHPWTMGVYVGGSRHSPVGRHWGLTPDRQHLIVGLHATVPLVRRPAWSVHYAPEVTPLMVLTNNPTSYRERADDGRPVVVEGAPKPVVGFGFAPVGFEGQRRLAGGLRAYGGGALGVLWFTREAPVLGSRAFNFTFEFGGGLLWPIGPRAALRTGYKFHHFSNAKTAQENPGVDAELFFVGVEHAFGRRP